MSSYNIEDIKLGDHYIVKAYKGDDLIFDRNAEYFIQPIGVHDLSSTPKVYNNAYIPIIDSGDIEYGDTVILDFVPPATLENRDVMTCLLGGSVSVDTSSYHGYDVCYGLHVSYCARLNQYQKVIAGYTTNRASGAEDDIASITFTPGERQTIEIPIVIQYPGSDWWKFQTNRTGNVPYINIHNGFYLFGFRQCLMMTQDTEVVSGKKYYRQYAYSWYYEEVPDPSGNPSEQYKWSEEVDQPLNWYNEIICADSTIGGKFYRITIKDSNNNLKFDFKPKIQNGHLGMVDLVTDTFYPCNDDTKFRISQH